MQGRITNMYKIFQREITKNAYDILQNYFSHFTAHMNDLAKTIDFCRKSGTVNGFPF